jgi:flagellar biosynthesis protein FlhF
MEQDSGSMKIKSYFSNSVEKAIQEARQEMGAEAMLLTTRRSSPETRRLGAYEVVFGLPAQAQNVTPPSSAPSVDLSVELQSLQSQLEEVKSALQLGGARPQVSAVSLPEELGRELVDSGLELDFARTIAEEAVAAWRQLPQTPKSIRGGTLLRQLAIESISKRLRFAPDFTQQQVETGRVVVFVGPPGAGKTTTLAKFAVQYCLATQHSVRIISVDPHRVASHEKLRALSTVIGIGFTPASSMSEFREALEEFRGKNVILIDTPGYAIRDFDGASDIAGCLARASHKHIHLVLPASMKRADLSRYVRQYEVFQPDYLLFSKLDETESCGAALSTALEFGKPLSFLTDGQSIPEDLEPANSGALTAYLSMQEPAEAISAA